MKRLKVLSLIVMPLVVPVVALGQKEAGDAKEIVTAAVKTELEADRNDHSAYMYRDHDVTPDKDTVYLVVETPEGSLKRKLEDHALPLSADQRHVEDLRIHAFVNDKSVQEKQRKDSAHDDEQAEAMLKLLPVAFAWTIQNETPERVTLGFKPDPTFKPTSMEARVLSTMAGEIVVARPSNRIEHIKGQLTDDVKIGYGLLGRLKQGGTFNVERREIVPGHWQITATHVHIDGRALLFKTIGQQEDETKTGFKPSPSTTLEQAQAVLSEAH
jgi:hypothetical protein